MSTGVITYIVALFGLFLGYQQAPEIAPPPTVLSAPQEAVVATPTTPANTANLASCLTGKGAKLYGAYWCSHCNSQRASFGDGLANLSYVECDIGGPNGQPETCITAGIEAYPTWQMPGAAPLIGKQQLEALAVWSGCPYTI